MIKISIYAICLLLPLLGYASDQELAIEMITKDEKALITESERGNILQYLDNTCEDRELYSSSDSFFSLAATVIGDMMERGLGNSAVFSVRIYPMQMPAEENHPNRLMLIGNKGSCICSLRKQTLERNGIASLVERLEKLTDIRSVSLLMAIYSAGYVCYIAPECLEQPIKFSKLLVEQAHIRDIQGELRSL